MAEKHTCVCRVCPDAAVLSERSLWHGVVLLRCSGCPDRRPQLYDGPRRNKAAKRYTRTELYRLMSGVRRILFMLPSLSAFSSPVALHKAGRPQSAAVLLLDALPSMPLCSRCVFLSQHLSLLHRFVQRKVVKMAKIFLDTYRKGWIFRFPIW